MRHVAVSNYFVEVYIDAFKLQARIAVFIADYFVCCNGVFPFMFCDVLGFCVSVVLLCLCLGVVLLYSVVLLGGVL